MLLLAILLLVLNVSFITTTVIIAFLLLLVEGKFVHLFATIVLCELSLTTVITDSLND